MRLERVAGFETHATYARLLVSAALAVEPADVHPLDAEVLSTKGAVLLEDYFSRSPLPPVPLYLGYCYVGGVRLAVSEATLIPGSETERMFDVATELASRIDARLIAEAGTGCGKIAIVLARRLPKAALYATDCASDALDIARRNIATHGLEDRIKCYHGDWLDPLRADGLGSSIDLIVSNPPYCEERSLAELPSGFATFAPRLAINGGKDGLACHRAIVSSGLEFLRADGWLLLQTDEGQTSNVADCIRHVGGFGEPRVERGSRGTPRFVCAQRRAG